MVRYSVSGTVELLRKGGGIGAAGAVMAAPLFGSNMNHVL